MILARLLSAQPQTDGEHWDLQFRLHYDAWHTDAYGQNPTPFQRNPQLGVPNRPPYPWQPYGGGSTFTVQLNTTNAPPTLDIYGNLPINAPPSGYAPQCPIAANVSTTGGGIASGSYLVVIAASPGGPVSQYMIQATIPAGTTTGQITVPNVVWEAAAPNITVYIGTDSQHMSALPSLYWTGSSPDAYGNPTAFTINSANNYEGIALPDPVFNSLLCQAKLIWHGGVWFDFATSAGSSGGHATVTNPAWNWGVNQWAGYTVSRYDADPITGARDFTVLSNTATTITFGGITGPPAGVPLCMRALAGSITASTIGDANFVNAQSPAGLTVNGEAGRLIRITQGTGAGQPVQVIQSNTATVFTIAGTWLVMPDATSRFIVEDANWAWSVESSTATQGATSGGLFRGPAVPCVASIPITAFNPLGVLIEAVTTDVNGNWSIERYAPVREVYVPANTLPGPTLSGFAVPVSGGVATPDASQAVNILGPLTANVVLALPVNVPTGSSVANWTLVIQQDGVGGRVVDTTAYAQLPYGLSNADSLPNTECVQGFSSSASGTRCLAPAQMNLPIT